MGPGSYNRPAEKLNNISFGSKYDVQYNRTPGPGYYNTDRGVSATKYSAASWHMRGKSREIKMNQTMGPGDYDTFKGLGHSGVKYTIGTKDNYKSGDTTPPVGAYELSKSQ